VPKFVKQVPPSPPSLPHVDSTSLPSDGLGAAAFPVDSPPDSVEVEEENVSNSCRLQLEMESGSVRDSKLSSDELLLKDGSKSLLSLDNTNIESEESRTTSLQKDSKETLFDIGGEDVSQEDASESMILRSGINAAEAPLRRREGRRNDGGAGWGNHGSYNPINRGKNERTRKLWTDKAVEDGPDFDSGSSRRGEERRPVPSDRDSDQVNRSITNSRAEFLRMSGGGSNPSSPPSSLNRGIVHPFVSSVGGNSNLQGRDHSAAPQTASVGSQEERTLDGDSEGQATAGAVMPGGLRSSHDLQVDHRRDAYRGLTESEENAVQTAVHEHDVVLPQELQQAKQQGPSSRSVGDQKDPPYQHVIRRQRDQPGESRIIPGLRDDSSSAGAGEVLDGFQMEHRPSGDESGIDRLYAENDPEKIAFEQQQSVLRHVAETRARGSHHGHKNSDKSGDQGERAYCNMNDDIHVDKIVNSSHHDCSTVDPGNLTVQSWRAGPPPGFSKIASSCDSEELSNPGFIGSNFLSDTDDNVSTPKETPKKVQTKFAIPPLPVTPGVPTWNNFGGTQGQSNYEQWGSSPIHSNQEPIANPPAIQLNKSKKDADNDAVRVSNSNDTCGSHSSQDGVNEKEVRMKDTKRGPRRRNRKPAGQSRGDNDSKGSKANSKERSSSFVPGSGVQRHTYHNGRASSLKHAPIGPKPADGNFIGNNDRNLEESNRRRPPRRRGGGNSRSNDLAASKDAAATSNNERHNKGENRRTGGGRGYRRPSPKDGRKAES